MRRRRELMGEDDRAEMDAETNEREARKRKYQHIKQYRNALVQEDPETEECYVNK